MIVAVAPSPFPRDAPPSLEKSARFEVSDEGKVGGVAMARGGIEVMDEEDADMLEDPLYVVVDERVLVLLVTAKVILLGLTVLTAAGFTVEEETFVTQAPPTHDVPARLEYSNFC